MADGQFGANQFGETVFGGSEGTVLPETTVWRVIRNKQFVVDGLYDVQVTDTANPFGNYAIAYVDDFAGTKFDDFPRGTRLDFQYSTDGGQSYTTRFTGFVVEARELDQQGADSLEIECYSFDQFLRKGTVSNNQSGNTISEALEDIIKTDTPVDWVAANVTVEDDITLEQSLRGEKVENAIQTLRSKSANEQFGVNRQLEFFFNPPETTSAPRGIDNSQWVGNYDIPEEGKRAINEVTVFFDSGNESVTVSDGGDKLALQDSLGTSDPISFATEVNRPEITSVDAARNIGEQILSGRSTTLTGTITTYGLESAEPGEVVSVNIIERGIDTDFQIAELQYKWGAGETTLTIVEKRGDQDDLLVNLSDTLKRVELDGVNRDAISNRVTNTNVAGLVSVTGDVDGTSYTASRYTVPGLNRLRDGWGGDGTIDIAEIAVGNDGTEPSRTDSALGNETNRASASQTLPNPTSVEFSPDTYGLRFSGLGSGDYVEVPDDDTLDITGNIAIAFTVSIPSSLDVDANNNYRGCVGKSSPVGDAYDVLLEEDRRINFSVHKGGTRQSVASSDSVPADGSTHTVVCTHDTSTGLSKIYLDGSEIESATVATGPIDSTSSSLSLSDDGDRELLGTLDRVYIDAREWAADEVADYDAGKVVDDSARRLEFELNSGSGTTAVDSSGNNNDGTIFNPDWVRTGFYRTDIREVGLFASDGVLIARATIPSTSLSSPVTANLSLSVDNDASVAQGVLTNLGQTVARDIIADNTPDTTGRYAYGSGSGTLAESDTGLDDQIANQNLENFLVQIRDRGGAEFDDILSPEDTDPVVLPDTIGGLLKVAQTCWTIEAEDHDTGATTAVTGYSAASNTEAAQFPDTNFTAQEFGFTFTPEYTIPASAVEVQFRAELRSPQNDFSVWVNQNKLGTITTDTATGGQQWISPTKDQGNGYTGPDLAAGTQHELRFEAEVEDNTSQALFDVVAVYDNRFSYTFDNTLDANNYLSGPELYPDASPWIEFETVQTRRDVEGAFLNSTWNDVSNGQALGLSNDGGSTWVNGSNQQDLDANFASMGRQVKARVKFSRYGSRTTATPTTGFNSQGIDIYEVLADIDAITAQSIGVANVEAIIEANTIDGQTVREAGQQQQDGDLLTHVRVAEFTVEANQRLFSSEEIAFRNA